MAELGEMMANPFRLDGKVAVVTGAGKGIGRGIALCLAQAGADVVISARTQGDLDSVASEISVLGRKALAIAADVTEEAGLQRIADAAAQLGGPHIWVNNAGGLPDATPRYLTRTPPDKWDAQMDLNLRAVFLACQVAAQAMQGSETVENGCIINISSRAALCRLESGG